MFQRILVATDFSPASTPAFEQSVKMAKRDGALLLIAHAYQEPGLVELSHAPARVYEEWDQKLREGVERKLRPLEDGVDPATINGESERAMKRAHAPPAQRIDREGWRPGESSRDSNIHNRLKGIADAEAKPMRPSRMFGSVSLVER